MSFLSVFKDIERGVLFFAPIAAAFVPGGTLAANLLARVPSLIQHIQGSIVSTESLYAEAKQGALKAADVQASLENYLSSMRDVAAMQGKSVKYDQGKFQFFVADQVKAYNSGADFVKTISIS